ncbi:MAG: helix-turn-helix domain-containing protein [bacterium]|nr:helix-turn-helix domain-containing protein [bacterium]
MAEKLLTLQDVAERLAVAPKTIRDWLREGKLKGLKVGKLWRVREQAL